MGVLAQWAPTIVSVLTAVFLAGTVLQKQRDHSRQLAASDKRLDGHEERLNDHGERIARAEAWRDGYNAAKAPR